jgi:hypothetical protein
LYIHLTYSIQPHNSGPEMRKLLQHSSSGQFRIFSCLNLFNSNGDHSGEMRQRGRGDQGSGNGVLEQAVQCSAVHCSAHQATPRHCTGQLGTCPLARTYLACLTCLVIKCSSGISISLVLTLILPGLGIFAVHYLEQKMSTRNTILKRLGNNS